MRQTLSNLYSYQFIQQQVVELAGVGASLDRKTLDKFIHRGNINELGVRYGEMINHACRVHCPNMDLLSITRRRVTNFRLLP